MITLTDDDLETLSRLAQLIAGWKTTTPAAEWSDFDEDTRQRLVGLQMRAEGMRKCEDCPPVGYPTDNTRCEPCPRREPNNQAD